MTELREEFIFWFGVNVLLTALGYVLVPAMLPPSLKSNKHDNADLLGCYPIYPVLAYYAMVHTLGSSESVASRCFSTSPAAQSFLVLYVVRQIVSFPLVFLGGLKGRDKVLIALHHVLSIVAFGGALYSKQFHFFATLDGCCEITTVFLNLLMILKAMDRRGPEYAITGAFLWITFIIFRLVMFPYWLYQFYTDLGSLTPEQAQSVSLFEKWFYPFTTVVLLVMSLFWFYAITNGLLKALASLGIGPTAKKTD
eukprot:TRINITY_DN17150_c0_g1_i1.p1 TRINITY_DN17150_c0_g1~~TRINITY_DN17150_c0_g1_i1.p1  ORF type:complete len:253 (-),score=28.57 TRINITY_DN17150_c0_g1_i1:68-826(-)